MGWIILTLIGGIAYRIRGGLGNEFVRKLLGKRAEWEIPNGYIRSVWALFITLILPITWASPAIFGLAFLGATAGYFGGQFDLSLKENRTWKNYALLSARGAFIILPLALCFYQLYPQLWYGVAIGALMPLWYLVGLGIRKYSDIMGASQWGEFLIGSSIVWGVL